MDNSIITKIPLPAYAFNEFGVQANVAITSANTATISVLCALNTDSAENITLSISYTNDPFPATCLTITVPAADSKDVVPSLFLIEKPFDLNLQYWGIKVLVDGPAFLPRKRMKGVRLVMRMAQEIGS